MPWALLYFNVALAEAEALVQAKKAVVEAEKNTRVAEQLAKVQLPGLMVIGGQGANGGQVNPFDAVGLESFIRMSKHLAEEKDDQAHR